MGHIGNGYGPQAQQAYQTTAVSQELTLGLALFGTLEGVLLPPFNPTLVRHEHVKWSKRNSRHLVYRHWSKRIMSAGHLGKIGIDIGTYSFVASDATQRNTTTRQHRLS